MLKPLLFTIAATIAGATIGLVGITVMGKKGGLDNASHSLTMPQEENYKSRLPETAPDSDAELDTEEFVLEERSLSDTDIAYLIDETAGHPEDPSLPQDRLGASDEVMAGSDPLELKLLMQDKDIMAFVDKNASQPRFAFAMGRIALTAGYTSRARTLLDKAARNGSGAAYAYLADPAITPDQTQAELLLKKAIELGFSPASQWLAEYRNDNTGTPVKAFDFGVFTKPELVRAFYSGSAIESDISELQLSSYLLSFLESISDSSNLFLLENAREFYMELDPTLQLIASTRVATSSNVVGEATTVGINQFMGMLRGMQSGGSIQDMVANTNREMITPTLAIKEYQLAGEFDGKRLALLYQTHPEEFRRVYAGIRRIVKGS